MPLITLASINSVLIHVVHVCEQAYVWEVFAFEIIPHSRIHLLVVTWSSLCFVIIIKLPHIFLMRLRLIGNASHIHVKRQKIMKHFRRIFFSSLARHCWRIEYKSSKLVHSMYYTHTRVSITQEEFRQVSEKAHTLATHSIPLTQTNGKETQTKRIH